MKLSEAFAMYRDDNLYLQHKSKSVYEHYGYYGRSAVCYIGDKELRDITLQDVRDWEDELLRGRCQNTVRSYVGGLKQVLKYAIARGYDSLNPVLIPCPQRIPVTATYVTPEEVRKLISATQSVRNKFIISLLYASGIRLSELVSLDRGCIKDRQFTVIGKGKKERLCFIDSRTESLMNEYLATREDYSDALIISELFRDRVSCSTIQLMIRTVAQNAGITYKHITPHTFRHGHATNLIKNGADIRYVAQDLGHANVSTTMIYTHLEDPDMRQKYEKCHTI